MLNKITYLFEELKLSRRITLYFTLYLTYFSVHESFAFAKDASDLTGTAAIISAIMIPVSGLQGFVFKHYQIGRNNG